VRNAKTPATRLLFAIFAGNVRRSDFISRAKQFITARE
jgi:hypothetical protein